MDYKNYRLTWKKEEEGGEIPKLRLPAAAQQWDLRDGGHPVLTQPAPAFYERPLLKDMKQDNVSLELQTRPMGCVHGHNTLADINFTSLLDVDVNVPTSPIFARDLCGRIIHLGLGPESKTTAEWQAYNVEKRGEMVRQEDGNEAVDYPNIHLPSITFPKNCRHVGEDTEGYDIIENVFFTKFRTLDVSFEFAAAASGDEENLSAGTYPNAHLYPYKTRLDTFYADGFRLPQTQMVYARGDVPNPMQTKARDKLLNAWQERPNGQTYPDFLEAFGGEMAIEKLFEQGCTLIPTFEACNGINQVGQGFELLDYHPGRAVYGLHEVVNEVPSNLPHGTIIEVQELGYVTANHVQPAKVIVSDGTGYTTVNIEDPEALIPNMKLPHQRCAAEWGKCWLPTHPLHFEAPALWGWDAATGYFMQQSGPLWDPVHYHYASVDEVLKAFQNPLGQNRWLYEVPAHMHDRFYPMVAMQGFDTFDEAQLNRRLNEGALPRTGTKRVRRDTVPCEIGYHPLPTQFEFELDPFWFPELHPLNREIEDCPEALRARLCPIIHTKTGTQDFIATVKADAAWLTDESRLTPAVGDVLEDYPFLMRYLVPDLPEEEIFSLSAGVFLEGIEDELLNGTPQEIWGEVDSVEDLEDQANGLFDAVWDVRQEQLNLMRLRHDLYRRNPALYSYAWFTCVPARALEAFFRNWEEEQKAKGQGIKKESIPLGSQIMPVSARNVDDTDQQIDSVDLERLHSPLAS